MAEPDCGLYFDWNRVVALSSEAARHLASFFLQVGILPAHSNLMPSCPYWFISIHCISMCQLDR